MKKDISLSSTHRAKRAREYIARAESINQGRLKAGA